MKNTIPLLSILTLAAPYLAFAQTDGTLQSLFTNIPIFIDTVLIPFLFGIAFLIFVFNTIRYFVLDGSNEEGRKKAKDFAVYSVAAFVFLVIFLGIVNLLSDFTGLDKCKQPKTDYENQFFQGPPEGC